MGTNLLPVILSEDLGSAGLGDVPLTLPSETCPTSAKLSVLGKPQFP